MSNNEEDFQYFLCRKINCDSTIIVEKYFIFYNKNTIVEKTFLCAI